MNNTARRVTTSAVAQPTSTTFTFTQADLDAFASRIVSETLASVGVLQAGTEPALETAPTQAPVKAYRSAKGKAQAKQACADLWTATLADAGVKRAKDLSQAQMDEYRALCKSIWKAVPKTRSTKA